MDVDVEVVLRRRRAEREALLDRARSFAAGLPADLGVRAVVVFGSVARGDFNKWSDVDVLVVADHACGGPVDRHRALGPVPGLVQPLVWTPAEFTERRRRKDPIVGEAMRRGVWVVGTRSVL